MSGRNIFLVAVIPCTISMVATVHSLNVVQRMRNMGVYYIDGRYVSDEEAVLPVTDLAILRGYGVFDFMRTYGGRPFHLDAHIRRLQNSAKLIELDCPWSFDELYEIVMETLKRNNYQESNIRLLITGGDSGDSISPGEKPRLLVMVTPVKQFPDAWFREGVKIITTDITRYIPGAKSIDYIRAILALNNAGRLGGVESVYVDGQGVVLEGTTSNIFAVIDGQLVTPPEDILPGVTRDVLLSVVAKDLNPQLRTITREELYTADEVFLSSSNKEVLPVRQVDERVIGNGVPGPITEKVMGMFTSYTNRFGNGGD